MLGVPEGVTAVILDSKRQRVTVHVIGRATHYLPNGRKVAGYRVHHEHGTFTVAGWDLIEYKGI